MICPKCKDVTLTWQRQQKEDQNRASFIDLNKKLLGEDIVKKILDLSEALKNHPEKIHAIALLKQEMD